MAEGRRLTGSAQLLFSKATSPSLNVEGSCQSTQNERAMHVTGTDTPLLFIPVMMFSSSVGDTGRKERAALPGEGFLSALTLVSVWMIRFD